jgi:hypothetical protein
MVMVAALAASAEPVPWIAMRHLAPHQFGGERRQPVVLTARRAVVDRDVLALDVARLAETFPHRAELSLVEVDAGEQSDHRHRLFGAGRMRRRQCHRHRAAESRDKLAPFHVLLSTVALQPTTLL